MKQGHTLLEMATELQRQVNERKDFVAPAGLLAMRVLKNENDKAAGVVLDGINGGMGINEYAHGQIAEHLGVPKKYYDRMKDEAPELLAQNVNEWLKRDEGKRLVRTLDGRVRAFLSSKYRPLDNFDLANTALPVLTENGAEVASCALTDTRLYIKALTPRVTAEITKGDVVQAGIVISNSEIGAGAVRVEPLIYRLVCLNGMIAPDSSLRKYHVGKGADQDGIRELLTTEARIADDRAFWLKVRDVIRGAFNQDVFNALVHKMRATTERGIINPNIAEVIEITADRFALSDGVQQNVLRHLIEGGSLTQYGLLNAVTRSSQDIEDYDEATELERVGGKIVELTDKEWKEIAA